MNVYCKYCKYHIYYKPESAFRIIPTMKCWKEKKHNPTGEEKLFWDCNQLNADLKCKYFKPSFFYRFKFRKLNRE